VTDDMDSPAQAGHLLLGLMPDRIRQSILDGSAARQPYRDTETAAQRQDRLAAREEMLRGRWLRLLPGRFAAATMESLAAGDAAHLAGWWNQGAVRSPALLLTGATGVGKTWMAYAVGDFATRSGRSAIAVTVANYLTAEKDRMFGRLDSGAADEAADRAGKVRSDDLLILDDLGVEVPGDWGTGHLTDLLDARASAELATVITTNLSPERLHQVYGPRMLSRITDRGGTAINVTGPDRRHTRTGGR